MSGTAVVSTEAIEADAKRWQSLRMLPVNMSGKLYLMCLQALRECDDDAIPEDALELLEIEENDFYALADRAGIERSYKYRVYRQFKGYAPSRPVSVGSPPRTPALYRYYDERDRLLYIGITDELTGRVSDHVDGSSWMDFSARSTITRYADRKEAATAEVEAIKAERPLFNKQHNNTPEARRRLVEYLVERDRLDLLAPAVSRR